MTQASKALKPSVDQAVRPSKGPSKERGSRVHIASNTSGKLPSGRTSKSALGTVPKRSEPAAKHAAEPASKKTPKVVDIARPAAPPTGGRRIQVRRSGIHGKGMFALVRIPRGETIIEYKGELIDWPEALRRHPHDPTQPNHTFYFSVGDTHVIDGNVDGNASRWINHSCEPNCEADETKDGRVFIKSLRALKPGEELFFDYGLVIDERHTPKLKKEYECRCGAPSCRHTMLAPKR